MFIKYKHLNNGNTFFSLLFDYINLQKIIGNIIICKYVYNNNKHLPNSENVLLTRVSRNSLCKLHNHDVVMQGWEPQ